MGLAAAATAASAWLMQPVLDDVFLARNTAMLLPVAAAVLIVFAVKGVGTYGQAVLLNHVGQRILSDIQTRMYAHLIRLDLAFLEAQGPGNLISRFTNDVGMLRSAVSKGLTGLGSDATKLGFLIGLMFYQDWLLALISFFAFPAALLPIVSLGRRIRRVSADTQVQMGLFSALLEETIVGARHVKAYGMEERETGRIRALVENVFRLTQRAVRARSAAHPIMEALAGLAVVVVIVYGGTMVIGGATTPGAFFSFITALLMAYQPMKSLANLNANLQEGLAAAERIFALLDSEPAIRDRPGARALAVRAATIRFEEVSFTYGEGRPALDRLSLAVPGGRTVALVGPSGAGKSTILNLIPRFYDAGAGRVLIDGEDVREVTLASLRAAIALVSQEVSLFDDTVGANIAYGRPGASAEEIAAAARAAAADGFIRALPQGYDTPVGVLGYALSGGQRQRIAIARAMLKNAPILLLDEATSALDAAAERQVQTALKSLMRGRTTLVIAHRLSTVVDADLIHVIERGRVAESGRHAELLARGGPYARLYAPQLAGEAERPAPDASLAEAARARA
ncbi:MAG: ABC transporter ATP-binding protein [Proteobacteria bacterium]|nr:ABC transporter ATP-binding protein [Pseudomonadota bacterium]